VTSEAQDRARINLSVMALGNMVMNTRPLTRTELFAPVGGDKAMHKEAMVRRWQLALLDELVRRKYISARADEGGTRYEAANIPQLLVEARKRARLKNRRCADVLDELLEEHKRAVVKQAPKEPSRPKPPPTPPPPPQERGGEDEHRLSKQFSEQLRILTSQYVRDACVGLEDYDASKLIGDFTGFVREAADDLRRRLTAARKRIRAKQDQPLVHVTRASFDHACELLVVRGTYGKPVDLRDAKRRQLRRAADAHPDRWGGTPHSVEEFQAIIGAYSVLEQYMEELTARSATRSP
jgi:hypothetical protein